MTNNSGDGRDFRLEKAKHLIYIGLRIKERGEATAAEFGQYSIKGTFQLYDA